MDSSQIHIKLVSSDNGLWAQCYSWFLDTYFLAVEDEIKKGSARSWRRVDRSQRDELKKVFENLISQKDKTCLLIAFEGDQPRGYFLGIVKDCVAEIPSMVGYINGLYVDPSKRRQKVASRLYEKGIQWFQEHEIFHYELYVALESQEAHQFWSQKGFVLSEQVMNLSLKK
ncbi:MAG: GNAT family N-acetyltransferase [Deltaproteobacteria bacterium]|nr:MAG: GNAT family N-acetyltransferase [Deltaproteobacteria bacterium]